MTPRREASIQDKVATAERAVTVILRLGVVTSIVVIGSGMLLSALHHPRLLFSRSELARLITPGVAFPHQLPQVAHGIVALQGQAIMTAGILCLLVLPVVRVVLTGVIFLFEKDRVFTFITGCVLLLLLLSLFLGKTG